MYGIVNKKVDKVTFSLSDSSDPFIVMSNENLMSGYTVNIPTVIKLNLENYKYVDGFPILKELIQNACDAGATELKVGHYQGKTDAQNPLLRKNGVIVYNNGSFSDEDGNNIKTIGGENKRNDRSTIGKYGLGLKSIYHLCEAFFFYGHEGGKLNGVCPYIVAGVVDKKHESWKSISDDEHVFLQKTIESFTGIVNKGLTLIIPIDIEEKDSIVGGRRNIDENHPFNKGDENDELLISNVITSLAILSKTAKKNILQKFSYALNDKIIDLQMIESCCQVCVRQGANDAIVRDIAFTSLEIKGFDEIQYVDEKAKSIVSRLKKGIDKADKILDEEKVVMQLIKIPKIGCVAKLKIVFAVYLPLPEQKNIRSSCEIGGDSDYILVIHAPFAVDSGRRHIEEFRSICNEDVTEDIFKNKSLNLDMLPVMYVWWNKAVFQFLVAPNIASLLNKAVQQNVLELSDCQKVVKEIRNSFEEGAPKRLRYLFSRNGLVCHFNKEGKKEWILCDLKESSKLVNIPETSNEAVLEKISEFVSSSDCLLLVHSKKFGSEYFLPTEYDKDFIDCSCYKRFIESLPEDLFCNEPGLDYFVSILKANRKQFSVDEKKDIECTLKNKLKKLLRTCGLNFIRQYELKFNELCSILKDIFDFSVYKLNIPTTTDVWNELWNEKCPFVFLPNFGHTRSHDFLDEEDKQVSWLSFLSLANVAPEMKCMLLNEMVGSVEIVLELIKNNFRDSLNVFELVDVKSGFHEFFNYGEIERNVVFRWFDNSDNFVLKLARLVCCSIYKIKPVSGLKTFECDKNGVVECLVAHFKAWALSNQFVESEKEPFLKSFFDYNFRNAPISSASSDLLAFLLSDFDLNVLKNRAISIFKKDCCEVLKKIYFKCTSRIGLQKKVVDVDEDRYVFIENHRDILQNVFVDEKDCVRTLAEAADLSFLKEEFAKDRIEIFRKVWDYCPEEPQQKNSLYLRLPLHINCNGEYCSFSSAGDMFFNKQGIEIPMEGGFKNKLIAREKDSSLAAFQDKVYTNDNKRILTNTKAVYILFSFVKKSEELWSNRSWILENLRLAPNSASEEERPLLLETRWIRLKDGGYCGLKDLLLSDFCVPSTQKTLHQSIAVFGLEDTSLSIEERDIVRGVVKKNHKSELYKKDVLQTIKSMLVKQIENTGYIVFDESEKDLWTRCLEVFDSVESTPVFRIFNKFSKDPNLKEIDFFDYYKDLYDKNSLKHNAGVDLLEQLVLLTCEPILKTLFCKILNLLNDGTFAISQVSHYPTRNNQWETPENISCEGNEDSIPGRYKLPIELKFLESSSESKKTDVNGGNRELSVNDALDIINNSWRNRCQNPSFIDVILFLLQKKYRKNSSCQANVENALKEFFEHAENTHLKTNRHYWCDEIDVKDRRDASFETLFNVKMLTSMQEGSLMTTSLIGTPLSVERNFNEVYYGRQSFAYDEKTKTFEIVIFRLADSKDNDFVDTSVDRFLQGILSNIYRLHLSGEILSPFINQIKKVDQIAIGAARARIFDGLFYILKGVKHPTFKRLDAQMNKLYEKSEGRGLASSERSNDLNNELIREIENDTSLQEAVFRYVRNKVKQNQYSVSSILFELFQNADDSVNDLVANGRVIGDAEKKIIIKNDTTNNRLKITHFGRKINEIFGNDMDDKYKWDLLNMLSLSYSDKDSKLGDTGKFGLGFKSIYMLTEKPIVRSGELQFEIVAGLYPKTVNHEASYRNCTYFELAYKSKDDADACLSRFLSCSAYVTLFSKHIKTIEATGAENATLHKELDIHIPDTNFFTTKIGGVDFLLIDFNKDGFAFKLMFKLDSGHLVALDENDTMPRVWNLSPLEAAKRLPFIINADFELDTGRLNLAGNGVNRKPIDLIAGIFSEIVISLGAIKKTFVDDILNIMLKTYAMQEGDVFKPLAEKILRTAFRKLHRIPSGYGSALDVTSTSLVLTIAPTAYTDHDDEFLFEIQKFANVVSNQIMIASATVSSVFKNEIPGCLESTIFSIFELIPNKILSFEILKSFMSVSTYFSARYSFWKDFNRKQNLSDYKLMNKEGNFVDASSLILEDDSRIESGLIVHSDYRRDPSVHYFLAECPIFERNHNRLLQSQYVSPVYVPPSPSSLPDVGYDEYGDIVDSNIVELTYDDMQKLYDNRDELVNAYYSKLYDSSFYDMENRLIRNFEDLQSSELNETWCILLLTSVCQSLPFYNHQESSIRVAVSYLKDKGVIKAFLSKDANALQKTYDTFVKTTEYEEACLRPFEMLLRLHKIKEQFEMFFNLLYSLPLAPSFNDVSEILTTSKNYQLEGSSIHLYSVDRTFKKGMHFLLRELLRNDFWADFENDKLESIKKQAFMPKHRVLAMLGLKPDATSKDIYNTITVKFANIINNPTIDNTYDILFLAKDF